MPKYYIEMRIDFAGEIEAESKEDAEQKAWSAWGDSMEDEITYAGVYSVDVEELEDEDLEVEEE